MLLVVVGLAVLGVLTLLVAWVAYQLILQGGRVLERVEALETGYMQQAFAKGDGSATDTRVGLPIGWPAPMFELPDLYGISRSLSEWRGRRLLLVFFDPGSRFCIDLLPALAALSTDAASGRPMPLVIASGDVEMNRELFEQHGVTWPVLCQLELEVCQAYQVDSTPSGYLVNADGVLESKLTAGVLPLLILAGEVDDRPAMQEDRPDLAGSAVRHDGLQVGVQAPLFRLPRVGGGEISLLDYRGKTTLLVFTDPECEPCEALLPQLEVLPRDAESLDILLIGRGDPAQNAAQASELNLSFPIALQRQWEVSREYAMFATPIAYLVDEWGIIAAEVAVGGDAILSLAAGAGQGNGVPVTGT